MTLSQGARQRLALARAMLRRPTLLVLDEATNSLDSDNETRVMNTVRELHELTTLLIGHRLSTIRCADLIYVMEDGANRGERFLARIEPPRRPLPRLVAKRRG